MSEKSDPTVELQNLRASISRFFNNPKYSDITIKIYDTVFHAHRNVICGQSEYFEKALQEGSQKFLEAETKTIEFKEGSGAAHWRVFEYLYTGNYSDELSTTELADFPDDPELLKDVRVYGLADMFLIEKLKTLSEAKFKKRIQGCELDDSYFACVREVYEKTHKQDSQMRCMVVDIAIDKSKIYNKTIPGHEKYFFKFAEFMMDGGYFARDYVWKTIGLVTSHRDY
ncbi:hypothetical protein K3495_g12530 [Podosphaera aphanis]|nr:hypothetical protein K3495_g12530 [Podosphaera aphanis]